MVVKKSTESDLHIFIKGLTFLVLFVAVLDTAAGQAIIREEMVEFTTYPFFDPDPAPEMSRIYPYFYFHGYTRNSVSKRWKMVVLENSFIKVYVCPEIGGKVWGAIEKSTGKEFLYFNHVVKFRDVAMRGAWTSGGLEYNFGDIGHIPTCATPVDYITRENKDGSVSCIVGAIDLPSGTKWNVEIKVSPEKAFFETKASWFNNTELPCTYYHWMNAAAKAGDSLEFIYPGKNWIGHGGETGDWPDDGNRRINWYKNNNFGSYKSYHVLNSYSNFFGGYWHDENFGFGHYCNYDEKPGKKLWIWGLADEGMIWEDLLTDCDGQYVEYQSGKLFSQAAYSSTFTPFKHKEFAPHDVDRMNEIWFPLKETGGMVAASEYAVLNITREKGKHKAVLSALQSINDQLLIYYNGEQILSEKLCLQALELYEKEFNITNEGEFEIILGDNKLKYSSKRDVNLLDRPILPNEQFNWETPYGNYIRGLELDKQREFVKAKKAYQAVLDIEPAFLPALNRLALSLYRQMSYEKALMNVKKSLAVDAYDGEANYLLGLICRKLGDIPMSKSGFSIAMGNVAFRSASASELATLFLSEKNYQKAKIYAQKALSFNQYNIDALQSMAISLRNEGDILKAKEILDRIVELDGVSHFSNFESFLISGGEEATKKFLSSITNELPVESFLDLAVNYFQKGCITEAITVLELSPDGPVVNIWLAYLSSSKQEEYITKAIDSPVDFVFPHRAETAMILKGILMRYPHWKFHYYLGLILWNKGLLEQASTEFDACGNEPDCAVFYLAKNKLFENNKIKYDCLRKAVHLESENWRAALEMAKFYMKTQNSDKALKTIEKFLTLEPEQPAIGLCYAQCLCGMKEYKAAITFLENYEVLPFEGATIGHDLYNEVCVRSALNAYVNNNIDEAIVFAEKAKEWPVNLGVGKPYDVDERLENYILYLANKKRGDNLKAEEYASKIKNYKHQEIKEENSKLILQLKLLRDTGHENSANLLLERFIATYPKNNYLRWVESKFKELNTDGDIEEMIFENASSVMAYDTKFIDEGFQLVLDFYNQINDK